MDPARLAILDRAAKAATDLELKSAAMAAANSTWNWGAPRREASFARYSEWAGQKLRSPERAAAYAKLQAGDRCKYNVDRHARLAALSPDALAQYQADCRDWDRLAAAGREFIYT